MTPSLPDPAPRPPSPWSGSEHEDRHRWQLDQVASLPEVCTVLRALADELTTAHRAGWLLREPMRSGHLLATRPSRRQRADTPLPPDPGPVPAPRIPRWRLRVVDERPRPGEPVLDLAAAPRTPHLRWDGRALEQAGGPQVAAEVLAHVAAEVVSSGLPGQDWGLAPARVGPSHDLVADGAALRLHAVLDGALVRTSETLTFQHAADRAETLLQAAAAYLRLAAAAERMAAAGGMLAATEDGFLHVRYA
ncbi:MAG: hypothetical protein JWN17_1521 [Frankiales bacterium]|nr:hypothetical protein [Frankiales bacterium]